MKIYTAFVGCGTTDPTRSDIKYFNLMKAWDTNKSHDFNFEDSHSETNAVRDTSSMQTLYNTLTRRLFLSDCFLMVVSNKTSQNETATLRYEISEAKRMRLPIVIAKVDKYATLPSTLSQSDAVRVVEFNQTDISNALEYVKKYLL